MFVITGLSGIFAYLMIRSYSFYYLKEEISQSDSITEILGPIPEEQILII